MDVAEVDVAQLEQELRAGRRLALIDIRSREDFERWHIDPSKGELRCVPEADVIARPAAAIAGLATEGPVHVICNRGNASKRATAAFEAAGIDAVSVTGGMLDWGRILQASTVDIGTSTTVIQFRREARGCLSYLIASDGEALVVDPAPDVTPYTAEAERLGLRITRVFDTHIHADHLSGARELVAVTGAAYHVSTGALARGLHNAEGVAPVSDGDRLPLGSADIRVLSLAGHTTDMTGLTIDGAAVVLGDSVFLDSVARPDLEVGDSGAKEAAGILYHTIHERLLPLPDTTVALPCHYLGGRRDGPVVGTIGSIRQNVSVLGLPEGEFTTALLSAMPPRPANYLRIIAINLGDGECDGTLEVGGNSCAAGPGSS